MGIDARLDVIGLVVADMAASLAFRLADPAAVDAAYAELTAAGYHGEHPPWDAFWGQRYAVVHDPDGLPVDLFTPLAGVSG